MQKVVLGPSVRIFFRDRTVNYLRSEDPSTRDKKEQKWWQPSVQLLKANNFFSLPSDPQGRLLHNRKKNLRVFGGAFINALRRLAPVFLDLRWKF